MTTRQRKRRNRSRLVLPCIAAVIMGYFGFHALGGQYGVRSNTLLVENIDRLETRLAALKRRSADLKIHVDLLNNGTIERDMLDEQARYALNMVQPNEIVLMLPKNQY